MEANWGTADDDWEKLLDFDDDLDALAPPISARRGPPSNTPASRAAESGSFFKDPNAANPRHSPEQLRAKENQATENGERSTSIYKASDETRPRIPLCDVNGGHEISHSLAEVQGLNEERSEYPEQGSQDAGVRSGDGKAPASSKRGFSRDVPDEEEIDGEPDVRLLSSVRRDRRVARGGQEGNSQETRGRASKRVRQDGNAGTEWDDPILLDECGQGGMDCNDGVPGDGRSLPASPLLHSRELPRDQEAFEDRHGCHVSAVELPPSERDCSPERAMPLPVKELGYKIPGPAGAILNCLASAGHRTRGLGRLERHFGPGRPSHGTTAATDSLDFREGPWLAAMDFLNDGNQSSRSTIVTIKATKRHIPQLVGIINTAVPNSFGDLSVTLKDPTGTVGGTIHRKVMTDLEDGNLIAPGAVIILQKVAVFSPTPSAHYLNITVNNVDRIFGKDTIAPRRRGRAVDDSDSTGRDQPISEEGLGGMSLMRKAAESETIVPDCGIYGRHGVTEVAEALGNDEEIQPDCPNDESPGLGNRVMKSPPMPTILEDVVDSRNRTTTANVRDGSARRASQDDIAKAAGWDFSEDVELLLADDDFL